MNIYTLRIAGVLVSYVSDTVGHAKQLAAHEFGIVAALNAEVI